MGDLCPTGEINWHRVDKSYKVEMVRIVQKFGMPKGLVIDEGILSKVGAKWRSHKYKLKKEFFRLEKTQLQNANAVPKNVVKEQWIRLDDYWCTPKSQDTAKKMVVETLANSSRKSKPLVEEEIFNKLIYDKDKPNQRVVGYGHGVSHGQVFELKAHLRKSSLRDDHDRGRDAAKEELEVVKKENEQLKSTRVNLVSQVSLVTAALSKHGIVIDHPMESPSTETIQSDDNME